MCALYLLSPLVEVMLFLNSVYIRGQVLSGLGFLLWGDGDGDIVRVFWGPNIRLFLLILSFSLCHLRS